MRYLTVEEVAEINMELTEADLLRDAGLLASAVGRPGLIVFGEEAYPTVFGKVAALFESLVCNHTFTDGNKRTAVVAAIHMLNWNGYELVATQDEVIAVAKDAAVHQTDMAKITEFFEAHARPLEYPDLN